MEAESRSKKILKYILESDLITTDMKRWLTSSKDAEVKDMLLREYWDEAPNQIATDRRGRILKKLHDAITREKRRATFGLFGRIAATILIGGLVFSGGYLSSRLTQNNDKTFHLITSQSSKGEFTLPDGTTVWLNSDSHLTYNSTFGQDNRSVSLEGEAYFDVTKDKDNPFRVTLNDIDVVVLGTQFNSRSYSDEDFTEVVLVEGSVQVQIDNENLVTLKPNDKFTLNRTTNSSETEQTNAHNYTTWFNKSLLFESCSLEDILLQIERWYNVDIEVAPGVDLTRQMSLKIYHEPVGDILRVISTINNLKYYYNNSLSTFTITQ
ncbi:MAG: FecR family protein [Rikenellaceae bacterium]